MNPGVLLWARRELQLLTVRSGRREIALFRALGFTDAQVIRVHIWQSIVAAFTGIVIGAGVGFIVLALHRPGFELRAE